MTERRSEAEMGWFADADPGDVVAAVAAVAAVRDGSADAPAEWPSLAVDSGFVDSEEEYYRRLHEATLHAMRQDARERECAGDQQVIHAVRAMDDKGRKLT